ncbi:MAG: cytochrome c biogenesis protein DipZ [Alphaproteobacteria bacterium]|nr:cytochrome c biogenesis protein DipZ [Alphaproteobacteria bacterium]
MSAVALHSVLALAEGFGLAFSPCILPVLPFILAASSVGDRKRPFLIIGGFVASFTAFALLSREILAVAGIQQDKIQYAAFALLLLFGLTMVVPPLERRFAALTNKLAGGAENFSSGKRAEGIGGGLLVGALIGGVWTPCAGPILAAAILQIIQAQTNIEVVGTLLAFSIGAAVPMLAIALFGQQLAHRIRAFARHATEIRRGMGAVIVLFALFGLSGFNIGQWVVWPAQASPIQTVTANDMPGAKMTNDAPPAPEIAGITHWFNSKPLTLAQLKGKVVLVDFWTYSCINCIRTLPYIESWYKKYANDGFVVVGVHAPEFPFEGKPGNVAAAIKKFGITYPVAMDNNFVTWKNYHNEYWPAHYLIDRDGHVVGSHFGEGGYSETEDEIRKLLGLAPTAKAAPDPDVASLFQTPETYLGYDRARSFADGEVAPDTAHDYRFPATLDRDQWALNGTWTVGGKHITADGKGASLRLHFTAGKVYLVLGSETRHAIRATLKLNGTPIGNNAGKDAPGGTVTVDRYRLYELVSQPAVKDGILTLTADGPGLQAYAFTFGR